MSPHHIRSMVDYREFSAVVSATRQTYSIRTKEIFPRTKAYGWTILGSLPRGGHDADGRTSRGSIDAHGVESREHSGIPSSVSTFHVIRIRMLDGTIQKVAIPSDQWTTQTVMDTIRQSAIGASSRNSEQQQELSQSYNVTLPNGSIFTCYTSNQNDADDDKSSYRSMVNTSLEALGIKHGSIVTLHSTNRKENATPKLLDSQLAKSKWTTTNKKRQHRFDPYPELAKDYDMALQNAKIRRNTAGGLTSYSTLAALQSSLHTVEPQSTGTIQRIYMCHVAAAKFHAHTSSTDPISFSGRNGVALLLGTITTERKDLHQPRKARTSLSSTVESDQYCCAARVHAIWEPQQQPYKATASDTGPSDMTTQLLQHFTPTETTNVIRVAQYLGLQPVGWMFSYSNDRASSKNNEDGGLPVWGTEIEISARLQIEYMKKYCQETSHSSSAKEETSLPRFGTLAMDAKTGATEAFQISDVAVQMVSEDMFVIGDNPTKGSDGYGRYVTTRHPVIVDGKETSQLDSVLCLVNVALLSHNGMFTGPLTTTATKKMRDGKISNKIRKSILKTIDNDDDDTGKIFEIISDFTILLALDEILLVHDSEQLCKTLCKWARGQKKSVKLDSQLKERLRRALDSII